MGSAINQKGAGTVDDMSIAASAVGGAGSAKAGGALMFGKLAWVCGIALMIATAVVMAMTRPQTHRESFVALLSTFVSGLSGGCFLVLHFGMLAFVKVPDLSEIEILFNLLAVGGVFCVSGVPGWMIVRAAFVWMEKSKDKTIVDLFRELINAKNGGQ